MGCVSKAARLCSTRGLSKRFNLLSKSEKRYCRYLVERYAWHVADAIESAYIFGFSPFVYDYRSKMPVVDDASARDFGL